MFFCVYQGFWSRFPNSVQSFPLAGTLSSTFASLSGNRDSPSADDPLSLSVLQVIPIKFRRIRRPASPLFSGWNCTPFTFPFRMDEANGLQ